MEKELSENTYFDDEEAGACEMARKATGTMCLVGIALVKWGCNNTQVSEYVE